MNIYFLKAFFFLSWAAILLVSAEDNLQSDLKSRLKEMDVQIDEMTKQLKDERVKSSNLEMEAQKLLPTEWDAYTMKIQEAESHERAANLLEARLKQVIEEKKVIEDELKTEEDLANEPE